jgi:DNA repair protein SbcC/Rad50
MTPRRIKLKGFMSFRKEAELLFDGSSLWVLTGPNGAGKSAIFDAIAFALYGVHRTNDIDLKGLQDTKALINHYEDGLEVEFEFALGDEIFCVKRTLQKARRSSTYQVFRHTKADGSGQAKSNWVLVPGTHLRAGFDSWVTENIGLDHKAFTAAVFLGQGKSDALLCHKPEMRHKILSQIIDISVYERLHGKAKEHYEGSKSDADTYKRQLDGIPVVDDDQITELFSKAELAMKQAAVAWAQLEEIISRKSDAARWNDLVNEKSEVEQALRGTEDILAKADKIESDARRLGKLTRLIPLAERVFEERQRLTSLDAKITQYTNTAETCAKEAERLGSEADLAQKECGQLKRRHDDAQQQLTAALQTVSDLTPQVYGLNEMDKLRSKLDQYDHSLADYPVDLDKKIARLSAETEELEELKQVISPLKRYCDARSEWREAKEQSVRAQAQASQLKKLLSEETERYKELENKKEETESALDNAKKRAVEAQTRVEHIEERLDRFSQVDGRATCDYCGQKLTTEHLESERKKIETKLRAARKAEQEAEQNAKEAVANRRSNTNELKKSTVRLEQLRDEERRASESSRGALKDQKGAEKQAVVIIEELPTSYSTRIIPKATADITSYFAAAYPSSEELTDLNKRAALYETRRRDLAKLQKAANERDKIITQREPDANRLSELEACYPESRVAEIRKSNEESTKARDEQNRLLAKLKQLLGEAEQALEKLKAEASAARDKRQHMLTQAKAGQAQRDELARTISDKESDLMREGQEEVTTLTDKQLTLWREEKSSLKGADLGLTDLEKARRNKEHQRLRLDQIARDIERIPQNAQCPLAALVEQERGLRDAHGAAEKTRREAEQQRQTLEDRRERRRDLGGKYQQAARKERLYKELTRLLGHEYLQRHLLQQAETGIIENANEVLDRVSSGTLHLELTPNDDADNAQRNARSRTRPLTLSRSTARREEFQCL